MFSRNVLRLNLARRQFSSISKPSQSARRGFTSSIRRSQQPQPQSAPQPEKPNATFQEGMAAYRPFGAPFLKVFLGAVFTYQVIYYVWMKLETSEKKLLKNEEIRGLEKEAKKMAANAKS